MRQLNVAQCADTDDAVIRGSDAHPAYTPPAVRAAADDEDEDDDEPVVSASAEGIVGTDALARSRSVSVALAGGGEYEQVPLRVRARIWVALVLTQCISNIDSGGCAVLAPYPNGQITKEFGLTAFEVGFVLSVMYLGHTFGCLTAAYLLMRYSGKHLLCASLVLYAFCVLGFAMSNGYAAALASRLIGGFVSALLVVYGPLWVDDFGPPAYKSLWMSLVQAGVPLGITIGYLAVGFVEANTSLSWRYFFHGQAVLLILAAIFFLASPSKALNRPVHILIRPEAEVKATRGRAASSPAAPVVGKAKRVARRVARLLLNPTYVFLILALCALYFVVNGLQMWVTSYLEGPPVEATKNAIVGIFGVCSATGPVAGVLFGGWAIDRVGGYSNILRTSLVSTVLGGLACVMAFASLLVTNIAGFAACTWILLFFGGAVVPALVGMSLSTVETRLRPMASGFGGCMYNLLGFFAGPFLAGAVADWAGVPWGYRTIMGASSIAVVCTGIVTLMAYWRERSEAADAAAAEGAPTPHTSLLPPTDTDASDTDTNASFTGHPERTHYAVLRTSVAGGRPSLAFPRSHGPREAAIGEAPLATEAAARDHVVTIE